MFSFLSRMRLPGYASTNEDETSLPLPATTKHLEKLGHKKGESVSSLGTLKDGKPSQLNTLAISAPIPRSSPSSITGFDNDNLVAAHGSTHNGSSSASVSTGSAVTAYQYPASFSSLHQQQQQSYTFAQQSHRLYQQPTYSQSQTFSGRGAGPPNVAWVSPQEIGVALGGDEDQEDELDMADLSPEEQDRMARYAHSQFPAVIRLDSMNYSYPHENQPMGRHYAADQMGRSASAPPSETYAQKRSAQFEQEPYFATYGPESDSPVSPSSPIQGRFNLRLNLNTNAEFVQGVQSLRLVDRIAAATNDVFAGAYDYPRAKQLSPIAEVDYVSPDSLKKTKSLPFMNNSSDVSATPYSRQNTNNTTNTNNPSPGGSVSQGSEVTRPSPVYSSPFISRPLNRTVSQTSSRTTTSSSVVPKNAAPKSTEPAPSLPPLDLRPPFPGPHPPHTGSGPPLRPPKPSRQYQQGTIGGLSTIVGSEEGGSYPEDSKHTSDDVGSLHADSFVTASSEERRGSGTGGATQKSDEKEEDNEGGEEDDAKSTAPHDRPTVSGEFRAERMSVNSERSQVQSASESFIARRWESEAGYGSGGRVTVLRTKRQGWLDTTPAFWAFWLGYVCPFLWLIGGWHFTHFGEQPPRLTFWEFYFNTRYWKETLGSCCGRRKRTKNMEMLEQEPQGMTRVSSQKKGKREPPPVTRWVAEKQPNEQRRERLNDPKRSMRGISFGYPFIPRPMQCRPRREDWLARALRRLSRIVTAPNRLFDHLYGVKLFEVRGRAESSRRMFDPWIQRCRYAFCYALIVVSIGLCTASAYLIVYNTRQLRS